MNETKRELDCCKQALSRTLTDALVQDLQAADGPTRRKAARRLASLDPGRGVEARPLLERLLDDPDRKVREAAREALERLKARA